MCIIGTYLKCRKTLELAYEIQYVGEIRTPLWNIFLELYVDNFKLGQNDLVYYSVVIYN